MIEKFGEDIGESVGSERSWRIMWDSEGGLLRYRGVNEIIWPRIVEI